MIINPKKSQEKKGLFWMGQERILIALEQVDIFLGT